MRRTSRPIPKDGIGRWSEAQFVTAMVKGTSPNGKHYYPAFPYTSYQRSACRTCAICSPISKTLPAVQGKVRDHDLPFPFNIRRPLGGWKFLFLDGKPFKPDPDAIRGMEPRRLSGQRGRPLRRMPFSRAISLGGIVAGQRFAGGPDPEGEGWVPNITQAGLKDWSVEDIADLLETGDKRPDSVRSAPMAPVILNTSQLPPEDRLAMAVYLKSLPPIEGPKPARKEIRRGSDSHGCSPRQIKECRRRTDAIKSGRFDVPE